MHINQKYLCYRFQRPLSNCYTESRSDPVLTYTIFYDNAMRPWNSVLVVRACDFCQDFQLISCFTLICTNVIRMLCECRESPMPIPTDNHTILHEFRAPPVRLPRVPCTIAHAIQNPHNIHTIEQNAMCNSCSPT